MTGPDSDLLGDWLDHAVRHDPARLLIIDGALRISAAQLVAEARRMASALLAQAPVGSRIAFMLPNWHEAAIIYLGATIAGMVVLPILPGLRDRDLAFALSDSGARFIFAPENFRGAEQARMLGRVTAGMENPPHVVVVRGNPGPYTAFTAFLAASTPAAAIPQVSPDAVRMMMYTSGTTGRPKGVLHSHRTLAALIRQIGAHWMVDPGDCFLVPSPVSHIGGAIYAFECPLMLGSTALLMERWDPDAAVALAAAEGWTHMAGATPFLEGLLAAAARAHSSLDSMKLFICGGAAVPPALIRAAQRQFPHATITRVYGSTETPVATVGAIGPDKAEQAATTDGRPGIAAIRIAPHPAAPPGEGEIRVHGPQMLVGYHHPQDMADALDEQGWFRTGDLGYLTPDGFLVVTGRAKDIIIRHGENISAREVEDLLLAHPCVAQVAVVGIPDARTGERAVAVVVPRPGAAPTLEQLVAFLDGQGLARFKLPEGLHLTDTLPRNDAGKVLKAQLRADLTGAAPNS